MAIVKGFDPALSGQEPETSSGEPVPVGVWGDSDSGVGVFGTSGVLPPNTLIAIDGPAGVEGHGVNGPGVVARSLTGLGVLAQSGTASGVLGVSFGPGSGGEAGLFGSSTTGADGVVGFVGDATGVVGSSIRGNGVHGASNTGFGVFGQVFAGTAPAVQGESAGGPGVSGASTTGNGCEGVTSGDAFGVRGRHLSTGLGTGVSGLSVFGVGAAGDSVLRSGVEGTTHATLRDNPDSAAVRGQNTDGHAGLFVGRVRVTGLLQKAGGGFFVDHPLDPANKYLSHSFVESPEMLNVYSGTVTTDEQGSARVKLPAYFEALNRDFRYQLTVIGDFARAAISREIEGNEFEIRSDAPTVKVCWQVTGVRKDAWAEANRISDEEDKQPAQRGHYLHPELYESTAGIHAVRTIRSAIERLLPLPDELREEAERFIADLSAKGEADTTMLRERLSELRESSEQRAKDGQAKLDKEWRELQERISRKRPRP